MFALFSRIFEFTLTLGEALKQVNDTFLFKFRQLEHLSVPLLPYSLPPGLIYVSTQWKGSYLGRGVEGCSALVSIIGLVRFRFFGGDKEVTFMKE
jgi:hypothetical protein